MQQLDAGLEREPLGGDLVDGAVTRRAEGDLVRLGLRLLDHVLHGVEAAVRMREQDERGDRNARDGDQVFRRIIRGRRHQRRDGDEVARGDEDRVAVGRRLHDRIDAERAARAGAVLDHGGLAEHVSELLGDETCCDVGHAARGEWDDDLDGARGPGLSGGGCGEERGEEEEAGEEGGGEPHGDGFPWWLTGRERIAERGGGSKADKLARFAD